MFALPLLIAALTPGQIFDGLTGSCFETVMSGGSTDTHCFTASAGGKIAMDVHKVRTPNGQVVYEGVTVYRADGGKVVYSYFNSLGDLYPGEADRAGQDLVFAADKLVWKLTPDGYDSVSDKGTQHFRKVGPAAQDGL